MKSLILEHVTDRKKQITLPPSLIASAFECKKKFWYLANHIYPFDDPAETGTHPELPDAEWMKKEVRLPSGARIDLWVESQKIAVEVKNEIPHIAHVMQIQQLQLQLARWLVTDIEFQLWYPSGMENEVKVMGDYLGEQPHINPLGYWALFVDPVDELKENEIEYRLQELHFMMRSFKPQQLDGLTLRDEPICSNCRFNHFCHI